jgi:hypothetical protein
VHLTPTADSESLTVALAGATLPSEWSTRFDVTQVVDTAGVVRAERTLAPANATPTHLFELALWPDLGIAVDLGPPRLEGRRRSGEAQAATAAVVLTAASWAAPTSSA